MCSPMENSLERLVQGLEKADRVSDVAKPERTRFAVLNMPMHEQRQSAIGLGRGFALSEGPQIDEKYDDNQDEPRNFACEPQSLLGQRPFSARHLLGLGNKPAVIAR